MSRRERGWRLPPPQYTPKGSRKFSNINFPPTQEKRIDSLPTPEAATRGRLGRLGLAGLAAHMSSHGGHGWHQRRGRCDF